MNDACLPPGPGRGGPTAALAAALELVARGTDQLRAAMDVEWDSPAAQLYRAEVSDAVRAVVRDLSLVEEAMRRAADYLAAGGSG